MVMVVVECCCCIPYRLALMLVLTFAPSVLTLAPSTLTFVPSACGVILQSASASTPLAHMVVVTGCNLRGVFLQPLAQTLLAPVVVPLVTTCAGGLFPSTHWCTYSTCVEQLALCGGICIYIYSLQFQSSIILILYSLSLSPSGAACIPAVSVLSTILVILLVVA